jgi:DNA-binding CsgD family transcriptional regulator
MLIQQTESVDVDGISGNLAQLVSACEQTAPLEDDNGDQQIMLDLEHAGRRYLLVRMPVRSTRPGLALSPREQEIARMIAKGYPNKAIAAVLDISSWTVCTHLRRMFAKFGVTSRAAMVARLVEEGILHEAPQKARAVCG